MKIPQPFLPIRIISEGLSHRVELLGKSYTFGADGLISSIVADGHELLAAPMRIVAEEDGEASAWDEDYPANESESFIQRRSDEEAVICGAKQSKRFIVDVYNTVDYDGNIDIEFKLMTRGRTVAQEFGTEKIVPLRYKLDKLWLEVPLKSEETFLYHQHRGGEIRLCDGSVIPDSPTSSAGIMPDISFSFPFKPLLWLGTDDRGLGWFAESCRNWQPEDDRSAIEVIRDGDVTLLRIRLLDSHPYTWSKPYEDGVFGYAPVTFRFGFQATPVKPFPKQPYIHKALHLDCGTKIKGNYIDFLSAEDRFDRLAEKGVDTLILHEKWNKSQNWFELSEYTEKQIKYIVDECHKRGIKVLTYFGYELSTMAPSWSQLENKVLIKNPDESRLGGWWRVPFQRDYWLCYNTEYADLFVKGVTEVVDRCNTDGIYLDGTAMPMLCADVSHGCGWYDRNGQLQGSYQIHAMRRLFKRLRREMTARQAMINVHFFSIVNFTALPYIDQAWYGENLQFSLRQGSVEDMALDYFRAEYCGRNMGVPVEFIAYENRPLWNFENAIACSILHGILPRPNDIEHPLDLMSEIWRVIDAFPVDKAEWFPYWKNGVTTSDGKVKVSYYKYTTLSGKAQLLAFAVNISSKATDGVGFDLNEKVTKVINAITGECVETLGFAPYDYKILYAEQV